MALTGVGEAEVVSGLFTPQLFLWDSPMMALISLKSQFLFSSVRICLEFFFQFHIFSVFSRPRLKHKRL